MQQSLVYDWKHHYKPYGFGGAVKTGEDEGDRQSNTLNDDSV